MSPARTATLSCVLALAGCAAAPPAVDEPRVMTSPSGSAPSPSGSAASAPAPRPAARGAFYKDDGPGERPPADIAAIPDAQPRQEPLHRFANRPYQVLGREYLPMTALAAYRERGTGSWYGRRFHGQPTSSGEPYDMYAMSAAHPTLPIPSYARVTNLANGRSVVVRINDRGPFLHGRVIDLSYSAAWKLGYAEAGSASLEVETLLLPGSTTLAAAPAPQPSVRAEAAAPTAATAASGVYLQLGVFAARENAESYRLRITRELAWLKEAMQVLAAENLFRLHIGPYRSRDEANLVAERIRGELNFRPVFVVR
jgi:rare lipoprotein A